VAFTWTILDNRPPTCDSAAAAPPLLWPANHRLVVPIAIVGVHDPDGDVMTMTVTAIRQDEPVDSTGDGAFAPDGFGVGTGSPQIRAERQGGGNGRVYHIAFTADDGRGGRCSGDIAVGVPHDMGRHRIPIDDGPLYDSSNALSSPLSTGGGGGRGNGRIR